MPDPIPVLVITRTTAGLVLAMALATDGGEAGVGVGLVMLGFEQPAVPTRRVKTAILMQSIFISTAF